MVTVTMMYKLVGDKDWRSLDMAPNDYFIKDNEPFAVDSVPIHDHMVDYLRDGDYLSDTDKARIRLTQIRIEDDMGNSITMTETFWNRQCNRVIERVDSGVSPYQEIIVDLRVADHPIESYEIMRLVREEGYLVPTYHGVIVDNPDGSQAERKIDLSPARSDAC